MSPIDNEKLNISEGRRYLQFILGNESYAVELLKVKEVITPPEMTPIPKAPPFVCGLMNLRGLIITVIDLRKKLGISPGPNKSENAVIIFDLLDRQVGVLVDSIERVLNIPVENIKPVPDEGSEKTAHVKGLLQHNNLLSLLIDPVILLD